MRKKLLYLFLLCSVSATAQKEHYLLIGTYTGGKSEGIYVYKFNSANAENSFISVAKSSNPSFLAVSPNQQFVYAVNENADSTRFTVSGNIVAFSFNAANGTLTEINKQPSGGKHPCYVAVDRSGKWVFAGNYSSGSIGLLPVNKNGVLDSAKQIIQHEGAGPDKQRQLGPHVHSTNLSADNKYLFVPDLGIDKLMIYHFNSKNGHLQPAKIPYKTNIPGGGPRHMSIHPNGKYVYLLLELTGQVIVYKNSGNGDIGAIQSIAAHPDDYKGIIASADIHVSPDGKFLYCSNRGDANSISIFKILPADGKLTLIGHQSTMGKTPRNFNFDPSGNFLLVANQNTDEIVIFKIDKQTGLLTDTGKRIRVPNPVCLKWIK